MLKKPSQLSFSSRSDHSTYRKNVCLVPSFVAALLQTFLKVLEAIRSGLAIRLFEHPSKRSKEHLRCKNLFEVLLKRIKTRWNLLWKDGIQVEGDANAGGFAYVGCDGMVLPSREHDALAGGGGERMVLPASCSSGIA